jgi:hypothetical protein
VSKVYLYHCEQSEAILAERLLHSVRNDFNMGIISWKYYKEIMTLAVIFILLTELLQFPVLRNGRSHLLT